MSAIVIGQWRMGDCCNSFRKLVLETAFFAFGIERMRATMGSRARLTKRLKRITYFKPFGIVRRFIFCRIRCQRGGVPLSRVSFYRASNLDVSHIIGTL